MECLVSVTCILALLECDPVYQYISNFTIPECTVILGMRSNVKYLLCLSILHDTDKLYLSIFVFFVFLVVILSVLTTVFKSEGPCIIANFSCLKKSILYGCIF